MKTVVSLIPCAYPINNSISTTKFVGDIESLCKVSKILNSPVCDASYFLARLGSVFTKFSRERLIHVSHQHNTSTTTLPSTLCSRHNCLDKLAESPSRARSLLVKPPESFNLAQPKQSRSLNPSRPYPPSAEEGLQDKNQGTYRRVFTFPS